MSDQNFEEKYTDVLYMVSLDTTDALGGPVTYRSGFSSEEERQTWINCHQGDGDAVEKWEV